MNATQQYLAEAYEYQINHALYESNGSVSGAAKIMMESWETCFDDPRAESAGYDDAYAVCEHHAN